LFNITYNLFPLNEFDIKKRQSLNRYTENQSTNIDMEVFKPIINVPRTSKGEIEKEASLNVKYPKDS
jgi:hypothetical protein